ncbi:hypothetical protein [Streptomyces sp. NPDC016845]|uniref:hypothetical protein n=1 Tax=Streptomyces sp. NPDC016845 TaxID=3364972 RepID=UPI0037B8ADE2
MTAALCPEAPPCARPAPPAATGDARDAVREQPRRPDSDEAPWPVAELHIQLPPAYRAFCLLYQDIYLRYAQARMGDTDTGRRVVANALGRLATHWPHALSASHPAEVAWELLSSEITRARAAVSRTGGMGACEVLYRTLPLAQADAVVLRHRIRLDTQSSADLMGVEPFTVTCRLALAYGSLPEAFADCLRGGT